MGFSITDNSKGYTFGTLYNADSTKFEPDIGKYDAVITDPPYNISRKNNFHTMNRKGIDFGEWDKEFDTTGWIKQYADGLKQGGSFIVFCGYNQMSHVMDDLQKSGLEIKDVIRWRKSNPMPRNIQRRYVQDMEYAVLAVKGEGWTFNKDPSVSYLRPEFVFPIVGGNEKNGHPTQKPLALIKELIKIHTNPGDTIIDPFMGSGTTCVAAKELGRKFVGFEINKEYYDLACKRFDTETTTTLLGEM